MFPMITFTSIYFLSSSFCCLFVFPPFNQNHICQRRFAVLLPAPMCQSMPGRCECERSHCLCLSIFQYAGRLPSWFLLGRCGRLGKAETAAGGPWPCTAGAITHSMDEFPLHMVWPSHPFTSCFPVL